MVESAQALNVVATLSVQNRTSRRTASVLRGMEALLKEERPIYARETR